jgi:hypothetical protein
MTPVSIALSTARVRSRTRRRRAAPAAAELDSRADDGRTAVTEALRANHPELADYLREKGARGVAITADLKAPPKD